MATGLLALTLVREARAVSGEHYRSVTADSTNELVQKILARKGNQLDRLAKESETKDAKQSVRELLKLGLAPGAGAGTGARKPKDED